MIQELLSWFWSKCQDKDVSGNMSKVWLYLVHSSFTLGKVEIKHSDRFLAAECGLSRNTLKEAIAGLTSCRMIEILEVSDSGKMYKVMGISNEQAKQVYINNLSGSKIDTPPAISGSKIDTPPFTGGSISDTPHAVSGSKIDPASNEVGQKLNQSGSKIDPVGGSKIDPNYININNSFYFYIQKNETINSNQIWRATWGSKAFMKMALADGRFASETELAAMLLQFAKRNQAREYQTPGDIENHFWNWMSKINENTEKQYKEELRKNVRGCLNAVWKEAIIEITTQHPELEQHIKKIKVSDLENRTLTIELTETQADLIESKQYYSTIKNSIHAKFGKCKIQYAITA